MVSLAETPLTGEPDAGEPPVRFGGRGGAHPAIPTPIMRCRDYPWSLPTRAAFEVRPLAGAFGQEHCARELPPQRRCPSQPTTLHLGGRRYLPTDAADYALIHSIRGSSKCHQVTLGPGQQDWFAMEPNACTGSAAWLWPAP